MQNNLENAASNECYTCFNDFKTVIELNTEITAIPVDH